MLLHARQRYGAVTMFTPVRAPRRLVSFSPFAATVLLTAAIFLLPATSDQRPAQASVDDIIVSATHIQDKDAAGKTTARD